MSTAIATRSEQPSAFEKAIMFGDISGLDERGRMEYVAKLCESLGLNPFGRAFEYIAFRGKMTCYLTAIGALQLRTIHKVSITKVEDHGVVNDFYRITVTGGTPNRTDIEFGSIPALDDKGQPLVGMALENARKKCLTQAKTRLTKSLVGLAGMPAEDERDDYGSAWGRASANAAGIRVVESPAGHTVNAATGEVLNPDDQPASPEQLAILAKGVAALRRYGETPPEDFSAYTSLQAEAAIQVMAERHAALKAAKRAAKEAAGDAALPPVTPPVVQGDPNLLAGQRFSAAAAHSPQTTDESLPF